MSANVESRLNHVKLTASTSGIAVYIPGWKYLFRHWRGVTKSGKFFIFCALSRFSKSFVDKKFTHDQFAESLIDWLIDWLIVLLIDWLFYWLIDWLIDWLLYLIFLFFQAWIDRDFPDSYPPKISETRIRCGRLETSQEYPAAVHQFMRPDDGNATDSAQELRRVHQRPRCAALRLKTIPHQSQHHQRRKKLSTSAGWGSVLRLVIGHSQ